MEHKSNEIKAGVMVLVSALVFAAFLFAIFGVGWGEKTKDYKIYLEYVGGISEGSLVKFRGMDVGRVTSILLPTSNESRVGLAIEVNDDTPVREDSRAYVTSVGLMSEMHIEISAGSPAAAALTPGSELGAREVLTYAQLADVFGDMGTRAQVLMEKVTDVFNEKNQQRLTSMMDNVDGMIKESRQPVVSAVDNLDRLSKQLNTLSGSVNDLTKQNISNIDSIMTNLKAATEGTNKLLSELQSSVLDWESLMSSNNQRIIEMIENHRNVSQNMEEFSRIIKEQPWLLIRKDAPPERKMP